VKREEENARKQAEEEEHQIDEEWMQKILASPTDNVPAGHPQPQPAAQKEDEEEKKEDDDNEDEEGEDE